MKCDCDNTCAKCFPPDSVVLVPVARPTRNQTMLERKITLTQDEFDMVWELLLATSVAMKNGNLGAHRSAYQGIGGGPKDAKLTEDLRERTMKIAGKMASLIATGGDPIVLEIQKTPPKRSWWSRWTT